jgi:hypothetical protein
VKFVSVFSVLMLVSMPVFAYIDPGSGSAIMSGIIGFFIAAWLVIKTYWYKIKSLFSKRGSEAEAETQSTGAKNTPDNVE